MKPVNKGANPGPFAAYGAAKPELISRLGQHCSYCEAYGAAQDLHVEHIYPKDPHPELELQWENFLISCITCNSYKNIHFGNGRRRGLEVRFLWPHRENTFKAFQYFSDGRVELRPRLRRDIKKAAVATRKMVGLLLSPAKTKKFKKLGIAYDGVGKRAEIWQQVLDFRNMYLDNPTAVKAATIANGAAKLGYFSIWMEIFNDRPELRRELIRTFRADPTCFDAQTLPKKKGRL